MSGGGRVAAGGGLQSLLRGQDVDPVAGQGAGEEDGPDRVFTRWRTTVIDLGAQRRPIEGNELRQVRAEIAAYMRRLAGGRNGARRAVWRRLHYGSGEQGGIRGRVTRSQEDGLIVEKERVVADGEYNFERGAVSGNSYPIHQQYPSGYTIR